MPKRIPIASTPVFGSTDRDRHRRKRETGLGRLYDSPQWRRRTQPYILARDPFCQIAVLCGGDAASTDVDHITPAEEYVAQHGGDATYFFDERNLRGACHADHSRKTALEQRGAWRDDRKGGQFSRDDAPTTAPPSRT
jgi:hypothetical protein